MSNDLKNNLKRLWYFSAFDGGLYRVKQQGNAFFAINMVKEHIDYIEYISDTFKDLDIGFAVYDRAEYNNDGHIRRPQIRAQSKRHPKLTTIWERLYLEGRKVIDPHMISFLDAEALAIIFMADGSRYMDKRCNASPSYSLNIKSYSYGDQWLLKKALKDRLDLEFNINRQNSFYYLRLRAKDVAKFESLIENHVLPSFKYKLGR